MAPVAAFHRLCIPALVLLALLSGQSSVRAQDDIFYTRQTTFRIPFQIDASDRRIQRVILSVSEDLGRTFQQAAIAGPSDKGFTFTAKRDGWYYFAVQTSDKENKLFPASLDGAVAGLRVLVDTVVPDVRLRALPNSRAGQVGVEWDIQDAALDAGTLRLEFRAQGQLWQEQVAQKAAMGQARWNPGFAGPVEVRLQVKDRAGNLGEATTRIPDSGTAPMNHADEPPPAPANKGTDGEVPVRKISSTKISLNFKLEDVGPSDVSIVEIWKTRDGRAWQRYPKDADKKPPFIVEVEGEGRYGFTLIAKSGVGLGESAPRPGDQPQIWIEVDLTKPEVRDLDAIVGRGPDTGNMTITWAAGDKNLARRPISISYATKQEGPWTPVPGATQIENTGKFVWRMSADVPFEFLIRVEAIDEAGNVGMAETQKSIKVDLSTPKARVIGVDPIKN